MRQLRFTQQIPLSITSCWDFFSAPNNLSVLTPPHLGFSSLHHDEQPMYAGQIIIHKIRPILKIPLTWVTEITHVDKPSYFIDEQRFGPYQFWHHEHRFKPIEHGVEIMDTIHYQLAFGPVGDLIDRIKIKRDIEAIFLYRHNKLIELFGYYPS